MSHVRECQQCGETYVPANETCRTCDPRSDLATYIDALMREGVQADGIADALLNDQTSPMRKLLNAPTEQKP